jgi:hypothetical protein
VRDDRRHQEIAIPTHLDTRPHGRDAARGVERRTFVAAGSQPGRLARGVDTTHLHRHRGDTGQAQHQHHDQRGDRQCRFNGARAGTIRYTLVLSARPMMLVSAETIESPVTTV